MQRWAESSYYGRDAPRKPPGRRVKRVKCGQLLRQVQPRRASRQPPPRALLDCWIKSRAIQQSYNSKKAAYCREDEEGDEAEVGEEGGNPYAQAQSPTPATLSDRSLQPAGRPSSAYLLPGVIVTIAHEGHTHRESASDGQITLGVPLGNRQYVQGKVKALVEKHSPRLRALALLADAHGDEVTRRDVNLSFQLALHWLRQSANARSAHFLRSLPRRDVTAGMTLFQMSSRTLNTQAGHLKIKCWSQRGSTRKRSVKGVR
jgi:hypothetical protein